MAWCLKNRTISISCGAANYALTYVHDRSAGLKQDRARPVVSTCGLLGDVTLSARSSSIRADRGDSSFSTSRFFHKKDRCPCDLRPPTLPSASPLFDHRGR